MTVSEPINVAVDLFDLTTGCEYRYYGTTESDCVNYCKSLFYDRHRIVTLRVSEIKQSDGRA